MLEFILSALEIIAFVTTSFLAGLYFIFYNTVLPVLKEIKAPQTMVRINEVILNKAFFAIFFASPVSAFLSSLLVMYQGQVSFYLLGAGLAILGFFITLFFNVPLNNKLKESGVQLDLTWGFYVEKWGFWNKIRAFTSTASAVLFAISGVYQF